MLKYSPRIYPPSLSFQEITHEGSQFLYKSKSHQSTSPTLPSTKAFYKIVRFLSQSKPSSITIVVL